MRRGVNFPYRVDSAHWVEDRGMRYMYVPGAIGRVTDPHRGSRMQTSSRPIGVAQNMPALQEFGAPMRVNAMHAVADPRSASASSKWKAYGR